MSTKDAYKQKIEAELELVQAKLAEFKAQMKSSAADVRIKNSQQIDDLELQAGSMRAQLKRLNEASDDAWEELKESMENTWCALQAAVQDVVAKFKS